MIKKNPEILTSSFNPDQWKAVKGDIRYILLWPISTDPLLTYWSLQSCSRFDREGVERDYPHQLPPQRSSNFNYEL